MDMIRRKSVDYATLITHGDPHKVYHNFSKLGDGGYATVWRAFDQNEKPVALKVMVLRDSNLKSILEELANHRAIEHPNIVKFYAAYFEMQTGSLWVALEYCGTFLWVILVISVSCFGFFRWGNVDRSV